MVEGEVNTLIVAAAKIYGLITESGHYKRATDVYQIKVYKGIFTTFYNVISCYMLPYTSNYRHWYDRNFCTQ